MLEWLDKRQACLDLGKGTCKIPTSRCVPSLVRAQARIKLVKKSSYRPHGHASHRDTQASDAQAMGMFNRHMDHWGHIVDV